MSEYPNRPRSQGGWPTQPPSYSSPDGQPGSGPVAGGYQQGEYGQGSFGQSGDSRRSSGPGRPPRRRRRGRGWIALLSTLVVLAVLFVIADQAAKAYAQNMIASKFQSSSGLSTKPSVTIEGFPFLTQVAAHDIRTVDLSASNVQSNKLDISSIKATATGVHINSSFNGATIDHISGTALITFASLASATGASGVTITADPSAGRNAATVSVGPVSGTAQITQTGPNRLTVKIDSLGGIAGLLGSLGSLPDYTIQVPKLPAGLQVSGVSVTSQGVNVDVSAHNTTLSQ
jgi:cytoskeletal protein RodZ